ncbi:MAG: DNA damage-inducible protein D [Candidatus Melainabacteria bacterium]|jgi:DNA-damage-inducible protein D
MKKEIVNKLHKRFEDYVHLEDGEEFWYARELQELLGYGKWSNFLNAIEKAIESCKTANNDSEYHFAEVGNLVDRSQGGGNAAKDFKLTRYACYLIAQNGDPRKEEIAFAQAYFAIQTRKQELLEERLELLERIQAREKLSESEKELSRNIYQRGVDEKGFGRIRSKGDSALFGGHNTQEMKKKLQIPENKPLADFLPTVTIKAKDFATEITNFNTKKDDLHGEPAITKEHIKNNKDVRDLLNKSGIKPEELPPAEDIKKLERRVKSTEKKEIKNISQANKKGKNK